MVTNDDIDLEKLIDKQNHDKAGFFSYSLFQKFLDLKKDYIQILNLSEFKEKRTNKENKIKKTEGIFEDITIRESILQLSINVLKQYFTNQKEKSTLDSILISSKSLRTTFQVFMNHTYDLNQNQNGIIDYWEIKRNYFQREQIEVQLPGIKSYKFKEFDEDIKNYLKSQGYDEKERFYSVLSKKEINKILKKNMKTERKKDDKSSFKNKPKTQVQPHHPINNPSFDERIKEIYEQFNLKKKKQEGKKIEDVLEYLVNELNLGSPLEEEYNTLFKNSTFINLYGSPTQKFVDVCFFNREEIFEALKPYLK